MPVMRARRIEAIEQAMLELLLRGLGAYEGTLGRMAMRAHRRQARDAHADEAEVARRAARSLRARAIALGATAERYQRSEWRCLGL